MLIPIRPTTLAACLALALGATLVGCATESDGVSSYEEEGSLSAPSHTRWDDDPAAAPRPGAPVPSRRDDFIPAEPPAQEDEDQPIRYYVRLDAPAQS